MKNFEIHKSINSRVKEVALFGRQTKEGIAFRKMSYPLPATKAQRQLQAINNRIEILDTAEKLAMQDSNPKNLDENLNMIFRCSAGKIELMNIRESIFKTA